MKYLLVMLGGGFGSLARYLAGTAIMSRYGGRFPFATLAVNVTGCFLIGLLMTYFTERLPPSTYWRPLLVVGFLGGYTTFSSFEWETYSAFGQQTQILARDRNRTFGQTGVFIAEQFDFGPVAGAALARR